MPAPEGPRPVPAPPSTPVGVPEYGVVVEGVVPVVPVVGFVVTGEVVVVGVVVAGVPAALTLEG